MLIIKGSVGKGGINDGDDVRIVQNLLNLFRSPQEQLAITGDIKEETTDETTDVTIKAIFDFQEEFVRLQNPDGRVDIAGKTIKFLAGGLPKADQLSGAVWFDANAKKYPTSTSLDELRGTFRDNAKKFHKALIEAGAIVTIFATYRHSTRALLMHFCWRISKGYIAPDVADRETRFHEPDLKKLNIKWDHGNDDVSRRAAREMVSKFGISATLKHAPSLTTRHKYRNAIDMNVGWTSKTLSIKGADGKTVDITATQEDPSTQKDRMNNELHKVAFGYGVVKFGYKVVKGKLTGAASFGDMPHWSDTGG